MSRPREVGPDEVFGRMTVLVTRQGGHGPYVESFGVPCSRCDRACWLDARVAKQVAEPVPVCLVCWAERPVVD